MPVLPMIDLLILLGWTSLALGGVLKAIAITTNYRPDILTLGPLELVELAAICLLFALALAARTWVKANEPELIAKQRRVSTLHAVARATGEFELPASGYPDDAASEADLPTRDGTGS